MTLPYKIRVAVLYGGRSGEHEVSLVSAASVIRHLDRGRFEVIPVGIDLQGRWHLNEISLIENAGSSLPVFDSTRSTPVILPPHPSGNGPALIPLGGSGEGKPFDVIFPAMHGTYCEDGAIQGLLELADAPYVGAGILGSAVGMDKDVAKRLIRDAGLPTVSYRVFRAPMFERDAEKALYQIRKEIGFPCFVKPVNAGSSVGVHKVKDPAQLEAALRDAFQYDVKVMVEEAVDAREIEVAVLENPEAGLPPLASIPGEIVPTHEFYSYEAKYLDKNGAKLLIPAQVSPAQITQIQKIAREAFQVLECEGMARVDFFLCKNSDQVFFNEINTLPGFTSISMYPKMWDASGIGYSELLSRLIELAIARHRRKSALKREFRVG